MPSCSNKQTNKQTNKLAKIALSGALLAFSFNSHATVFDISNDFSISNNPNGAWSYGWESSLGSTLNLFSNYDQFGGFDHLYSNNSDWSLSIFHNTATNSMQFSSLVLQSNQVSLHPSNTGDYSVARWTTPTTGNYSVSALFTGQDIYGTTTDVHVLQNGTALFDSFVDGYLAQTSLNSTVLSMMQGDYIDFAIGYGSNGTYYNDSTGLAVTISSINAPIPEPESIALIGLGFLGMAAMRRKKIAV